MFRMIEKKYGLSEKLHLEDKDMTGYELDCIRFYMGDPEILDDKRFRGGAQAYNTINALLHEGVQNELDKIRDGKPIAILDAQHLETYISVIASIYLAMEKQSPKYRGTELRTYRVDRFSEIAAMQERKRIEGFYSTCKRGYLKKYANTKTDIVLMEIEREYTMPYLDFEDVFGKHYSKTEESEVLLPFDAKVKKIEERGLTSIEKKCLLDANQQPPKGKFRILLESGTLDTEKIAGGGNQIYEGDVLEHVQDCLHQLSASGKLESEDLQFYTDWKKQVKNHIIERIKNKNAL